MRACIFPYYVTCMGCAMVCHTQDRMSVRSLTRGKMVYQCLNRQCPDFRKLFAVTLLIPEVDYLGDSDAPRSSPG